MKDNYIRSMENILQTSKNIPKITGLLSDKLGPGPYIKVVEAEAGPGREWDHTPGSTPA